MKNIIGVVFVLAMVVIIISIDLLFLRNHFRTRLLVNVGIVALFIVAYFVFLRRK